MAEAKRDGNQVPTLIAVSNADGLTPVVLYADPTTHRLLVSAVAGSLDDLSDVVITSGAQGDILYNNGTNWVNLAAGTSGKFLKTQGAGANPLWDTPSAGAAGTDTQVQFNDGGTALGGDAGFTFNKTSNVATLGGLIVSGLTASEIVGTDGSKNLVSLAVATYPSLTELTYVKGVTSAIQTQLGTKEATANKSTDTALGASDTLFPTQNAVKTYVDNIALGGVDWKQPARLATAAALAANTYANGVLGVGATLTASANGALSVDGVAVATSDRILVKNEATGANNGVYTVTQAGSAGTPYILTRATDYDTAGEMDAGDVVAVTAGNTLIDTFWIQTSIVATVGTDAVSFSQFGEVFPISVANGGTNLSTVAAGSVLGANTVDVVAVITSTSGLKILQNNAGTVSWETVTGTGSPVLATSPTLVTPALGTPSSGTLTNCTGLPVNGIVDDTTSALGIGTLELGHATDTTISRVSAGVIAVEGVTVPTVSSTSTITNKRIEPRIVSAASYTTDTGTSLDVSTTDIFVVTAQAGALLFNAPGGTPVQGQSLVIRIKDNGTARALTWNAVFRAMGTALPSTTVLSKTLYLGFFYNSTDTKWDLVASAQEA